MNTLPLSRHLWRRSLASPILTQSFARTQCVSRFPSLAGMSRLASREDPTRSWKMPLQSCSSPAVFPLTQHSYVPSRGMKADTQTTSLTIWEDLKQMRFSPAPALALGFSGLIPFILPPAYMMLTKTFYADVFLAQTYYGACILSFLGGVRWGFALPEGGEVQADWLNLGYSVVPSLVACTGLLLPNAVSSLVIMGGIAGSAYFDATLKGYPPWFKGLRFVLSLGAVLSLWTVFMCRFLLKTPQDRQLGFEDAELSS